MPTSDGTLTPQDHFLSSPWTYLCLLSLCSWERRRDRGRQVRGLRKVEKSNPGPLMPRVMSSWREECICIQEPSTRQLETSATSRCARSLLRSAASNWVVLGKEGSRCLLGIELSPA